MNIETYWTIVPSVGIAVGLAGTAYFLLTNKTDHGPSRDTALEGEAEHIQLEELHVDGADADVMIIRRRRSAGQASLEEIVKRGVASLGHAVPK